MSVVNFSRFMPALENESPVGKTGSLTSRLEAVKSYMELKVVPAYMVTTFI